MVMISHLLIIETDTFHCLSRKSNEFNFVSYLRYTLTVMELCDSSRLILNDLLNIYSFELKKKILNLYAA